MLSSRCPYLCPYGVLVCAPMVKCARMVSLRCPRGVLMVCLRCLYAVLTVSVPVRCPKGIICARKDGVLMVS